MDARRIVLLGWSSGAQAVLEAVDASRAWPADTPVASRAVAFYLGCAPAQKQLDYRLNAPLLLLVGGNDDRTPTGHCQALQTTVLACQPQARSKPDMFGGVCHSLDGTATVTKRNGIPKGRHHGAVTVGGGPATHEITFAKLAAWLGALHL